MRVHKTVRRRGVSLVEFAIIAPIAFMLMFALFVGALGVFRAQQVSAIAREASRWASLHGTEYAKASGLPAATTQDIYDQIIVRRSAGLNLSNLSYSVAWDTDNRPYHTKVVDGQVVPETNKVTVTITYLWKSESFFGTHTFTSTSISAMCF